MIRIYAALALLAALVAGGWYMRHEAYQQGYESAERTLTAQYNGALIQAQAEAREAETRMAANANAAAIAYEKGKQDGKAAADSLRADRDAGRIVLRDKFRCPAAAPVPGTANPGAGDHGGAPAILSRPDEDFLVRLAAEADRNTRQLTTCQATLRACAK